LVRQSSPQTARSHSVPLLSLVVPLISLVSVALLNSPGSVVLLISPARVVLLVFPVSVVPVPMVVGTVCRVMFTVSKATLQPMATATLQPMATAILHAMATAMVSGDTATGDVMTSLSRAVMATALMAMPLPMTAPTPSARGDAGVF
jgi:hypothetical protein